MTSILAIENVVFDNLKRKILRSRLSPIRCEPGLGVTKRFPYTDPESSLEVILDKRLPEIHKMAKEFLRDQLVSIYYMEKCPLYTSLMNTAERLHRNSHLSVPLAITEAIRLYKPELTKVLVKRKPQEKSDE